MKADSMSLFEEFIKGATGSQFVIPVYQRNYTWKRINKLSNFYMILKNSKK